MLAQHTESDDESDSVHPGSFGLPSEQLEAEEIVNFAREEIKQHKTSYERVADEHQMRTAR
eukprot:742305-Rhodomonas_salina.1